MFDLMKLPPYYMEKYGRDRIAELLGQKSAIVAMWEKSGKFPLDAVQKLLEHDPEPLKEVRPLYEVPTTNHKLCILMPLMGPAEPKTMDCLMALYDKSQMAYKRVSFNNLSVARNTLAAWFLRNGFEWAMWIDGDMVLPCGDAALFKAHSGMSQLPDVFASVHTIYRLLSHRLKQGKMDATIVSVCYVSRNGEAIPQFSAGETPEARFSVRRGPRDELIHRNWVGFGGVLTHRSVFESIIQTQGDSIKMNPNGVGRRFGYEMGFFNPIDGETPGDDVAFSLRAVRAGHKPYVDMAVHAAHIGDRAYTYADIK